MQNIFKNNILLLDGKSPIRVEAYDEIIRNIQLLQKREENNPNKGFEEIIGKIEEMLSEKDRKLWCLYLEEEREMYKKKQAEIHKKLYKFNR